MRRACWPTRSGTASHGWSGRASGNGSNSRRARWRSASTSGPAPDSSDRGMTTTPE
jgi:hypothetical protein